QAIGGLSAGTLYHYRVKSRDGAGNLATSADATFTTTVTSAPVLAVSVTDTPDPVAAGSTITYTLTYSNTGSSGATGVVLSDTVPVKTTLVSATGGGTLSAGGVAWSIGGLAHAAWGSTRLRCGAGGPGANGPLH